MNYNDDFICNVLIIGKTGTGKSSLLNYLCNKKMAEVGAGKPVTGENIYEYKVNINNQEVRVFDSWGIEPGKTARWSQLVKNSQRRHGVQCSIEEWFHCVIYCIQAGGKIVSADSDIIRQFLKDGYHLTLILTKADQVSKDELETMIRAVQEEVPGVKIIATCAEHKNTRTYMAEPFGKEEAVAAIFEGWKETIIERIPKHIIGQICKNIDEWVTKQKNYIPFNNISGKKSDNKGLYQRLIEYAREEIDNIQEYTLPDLLKESLNSCKRATRSLSRIFNHGIYIIDDNILENVESELLDTYKKWSDFLKFNSKKNIASQKEELCAFVDKLAEEIKNEVKNKEKQIAIIFESFLQQENIYEGHSSQTR